MHPPPPFSWLRSLCGRSVGGAFGAVLMTCIHVFIYSEFLEWFRRVTTIFVLWLSYGLV